MKVDDQLPPPVSARRGNAHACSRLSAAFAMRGELPASLFDAETMLRLDDCARFVLARPITSFDDVDDDVLATIDVLITGWDSPVIDERALARMPRLGAVFHAAGTVKQHLTPAVWERGVLVTTAAAANALPVAEYTVAMILLAGKGVIPPTTHDTAPSPIGNHGRVVGIIGASTVGRQVIRLLEHHDLAVQVFDPTLDDDDPCLRQATRVDLSTLMETSSIVSVHAPLLDSTVGMIGEAEIADMVDGATLINTARAAIVDQEALLAAVEDGRIRAILDVTDPEPLPPAHPLHHTPGVFLTPHVAGALGNELERLGASVATEVHNFAHGLPPLHAVRLSDLDAMA